MKRIKSVIAIITLVIFVFGLSGCGLISKTAEGQRKTAIAKVNGEKITLGDFQDRLEAQKMQYELYSPGAFTTNPTLLDNLKDQLFTQMLQEEVLMQKAEELKLVVTDKDLEAEVQKQIAADIKSAGSEKKFNEVLTAQKTNKEKYTEQLRNSLKMSMTVKKVYDNIARPATVKETEVISEYNLNKYNYTEKPNTMKVSHIVVPTKAEAEKILKEIKAGMTFEAAAKKYGTDGTKDSGGSLGEIKFNEDGYDKDFLKGAIATKVGTVSGPVKSAYGYHLIKVTSKKEYKMKPLSAVKAEITKTLLEEHKKSLFNTAFTTWYNVAKIEEFKDEIK